MRIHNRHDIAGACASESTKYAIDCVHIFDVGGEPHAVASDGRILALVPVWLGADDSRGTYACEAFALARSQFLDANGGDDDDLSHSEACYGLELHDSGRAVVLGMVEIRTRSLEWCKPITLEMVQDITGKAANHVHSVMVDVDLLSRLANALGSRKVLLSIGSDDQPIKVVPIDEANRAVGYLMPIFREPRPRDVAATGGVA